MKQLLLIMPKFFDYPNQIVKELNLAGFEVDYYDDRPSTNQFVKAIIRINKNIINRYIKKYFEKLYLETSRKQYDVVLIVSGQSLSFGYEMIERLKKQQKKAKFCLYQWDSIDNFPYIKNFFTLFDSCFSFDKNDCEEYNLKFLPLFYTRDYQEISCNSKDKYDCCFIGTAHPKKYEFIKEIKTKIEEKYNNNYFYLYLPGWILFIYRKIFNKEFRGSRLNEFKYKPLTNEETINIIRDSKIVLDSPQNNQRGLTIRTIEALGAKKKLITTNEDIMNYDFYKPENIYVYKGALDTKNLFFTSSYSEINKNIYEKYSLKNWLSKIINE